MIFRPHIAIKMNNKLKHNITYNRYNGRIDIMMRESTFINVMLEEIVLASSVQELLDMEGGVTQEPPSTCLTLDIAEELDVETDTTPQEPPSTLEQGTTQARVSTQSRDVADKGKETKATTKAKIDQVGKILSIFLLLLHSKRGEGISLFPTHGGGCFYSTNFEV